MERQNLLRSLRSPEINGNAILIAVYDEDDSYLVNPSAYTFKGVEDVVLIAQEAIRL